MSDISDIPQFPFPRTGPGALAPRPFSFPDGLGPVRLLSGQVVWLVTRHEYVRDVLRSPDFTTDMTQPGFPRLRPKLAPELMTPQPGALLRMDGLEHARLRRMIVPEFTSRRVRWLEPLIRETVTDTLEVMAKSGPPADLVRDFALPVPSMVICHLLGVPYTDHAFFQDRSRKLLESSTTTAAALAARDDLHDYFDGLIRAKQRDGGDDLVSRLAAERVATGELTAEELVGVSMLLLVAGHETTANMIGLGALTLLHHPGQLRRLREHPESIDDAVEELLRYLTVVHSGLARVAVADTVIGGQAVKAGEGVIAWLSGADHDATVFPDPGELDLSRDSHLHVAFGFGAHQCLGQPLARAELRVALPELFARLPGLRLAVDPAEIEFRDAFILGVRKLPVAW